MPPTMSDCHSGRRPRPSSGTPLNARWSYLDVPIRGKQALGRVIGRNFFPRSNEGYGHLGSGDDPAVEQFAVAERLRQFDDELARGAP